MGPRITEPPGPGASMPDGHLAAPAQVILLLRFHPLRTAFMELLLLSNGKTTEHPGLLGWARERVQTLLARKQVKRILLIPYAVIRSDWNARAFELSESLGGEGHQHPPLRRSGGCHPAGRRHLHQRRQHLAPEPAAARIRPGGAHPARRARAGVPYVGWSAGCNVATPSILTTNDMPVCSAAVLPALGLFPCRSTPPLPGCRHQRPHGETGTSGSPSSVPSTRASPWWPCAKGACFR